jgi:L-amino acid N-acyltransferase YncA
MNVLAAAKSEFGWIEARTGCVLSRNATAIKATDTSGRIRGMVAYDSWTENAVQAHMAVDAAIAWRSLLRPAFAYPFEEAGRGVLLAVVQSSNRASMRLVERFGFREAYRMHDGWAEGNDLVFMELRRAECRFLAGRERRAA